MKVHDNIKTPIRKGNLRFIISNLKIKNFASKTILKHLCKAIQIDKRYLESNTSRYNRVPTH